MVLAVLSDITRPFSVDDLSNGFSVRAGLSY